MNGHLHVQGHELKSTFSALQTYPPNGSCHAQINAQYDATSTFGDDVEMVPHMYLTSRNAVVTVDSVVRW